MALIDVSLPLEPGCPHWPGDPPFSRTLVSSTDDGDRCNVSTIAGSVHLGTHMDAPCHFVPGGASVDQWDVELFVGPSEVVEIVAARDVSASDLAAAVSAPPHRLLLRTRNSAPGGVLDRGTPADDYCGLTADAAQWVVDHAIGLIGIDGWSIGAAADGAATHRVLLSAGVAVLEGLDLRTVRPGPYALIAPPVKLTGSDGAAVRALLRPTPTV